MFPGNFRFRGGKENFRVATASRKYPLQVEDVTFFVNPYALSQVSPVFEVMALDQGFVENKNLKACIEEESPEDIEIFLEAICPTYYGVYPDTVKEETFPILARLADKFLVDGLRCGCEEFILRCRLNKQSPNSLLRMLITCCSFNLKDRLKKLLLKHLLKVKDQNVVIDEDLKQHPIGELVCHELTNSFTKHYLVYFEKAERCQVCKKSLSITIWRCTGCLTALCSCCSNSICPKSLNSRVDYIYSEIEKL